ncbi:hypothetical protein [Kocuria oceani]|uniref:Uncharacterized protein n=1 Tax=Kocuria oceani TaxID=988827 RepID=A0ABV9TNL8_9MICC|nr:hypothetical protein [Kocuria oceani]
MTTFQVVQARERSIEAAGAGRGADTARAAPAGMYSTDDSCLTW